MSTEPESMLREVGAYYSDKLRVWGATARGVDWNTHESQELRFRQLALLWDGRTSFSLNDIGCGYGALYEYLQARAVGVDYLGIDVSSAMIEEACRRTGTRANCTYSCTASIPRTADYCVASGIFNVKLGSSEGAWRTHVFNTLIDMHEASGKGFAFNCLTVFSDQERMRKDLYYADPCELFNYCKRSLAPHVALLHDYGLYEFTIIVRKEPA